MALSAILGPVSRNSSSSPKHRTGARSSKPWPAGRGSSSFLFTPQTPIFPLLKAGAPALVVRRHLASGTFFWSHRVDFKSTQSQKTCEISAINALVGFSYAYIHTDALIHMIAYLLCMHRDACFIYIYYDEAFLTSQGWCFKPCGISPGRKKPQNIRANPLQWQNILRRSRWAGGWI